MTAKLVVLFLTVASLSFAKAAPPQQCTETSLNYREVSPNFALTFSATLSVTLQGKQNQVIVTNIQANVTNPSYNITNICAVDVTARNVSNCVADWTKPLTINLGDGVLELQALIYSSGGQIKRPFYSAVVDEASFSFYDGKFYDTIGQCYTYIDTEQNFQFNATECCTKSQDIVQTAPAASTCNKFTSVSNMMVGNQTTATITFDYDLYNGNITMFGRVTGAASDFHPIYIINDAEGCQVQIDNTILCGYPLAPTGNKLIFFLTEFRLNRTRESLPTAMTSRLIIRNGTQTLMAENKPFTTANSCQNYNSTYGHANSMLITSLCCTSFLDGSTTMSVPTTTNTATGQSTMTGTTSPGPTQSTTTSGSVMNSFNAIAILVIMFFLASKRFL